MNRTLRTALAAGVAAGVTATLCIAPPANAASLSGTQMSIGGQATYNTSSCTTTGGAPPATLDDSFADGDAISHSETFSQVVAKTGDTSDTVTFSGGVTSTVRSASGGGDLTSISITTKAHASFSAAKGLAVTGCGATGGTQLGAQVEATAGGTLHRAKAGWAHIQVSATGTGIKQAGLVMFPGTEATSGLEAISLSPRNLTKDEWLYLEPGDYMISLVTAGTATQSLGMSSTDVTESVKVSFVAGGTAKAPASGKAKPVVSLPGKLTCSTGKATVNLTKKAKGTTSVALYVNGKKKTTIRHPHGARSVTLSGVPKTTDVTLKAVVKTGTRSATVSRSYHSC